MSKPAAKPAAAAGGAEEAPKKSKLLIIIIAVLVLVIGGGAAAFFMLGKHKADDEEEKPAKAAHVAPPKFVAMEPLTVNLVREEGDQFLQIGVSLKIVEPELEEKIKGSMPEIRSKMLLLLSSKKASELSTAEGKAELVKEIIEQTDEILGIDPEPPRRKSKKNAEEDGGHKAGKTEGIIDVAFTSFIIQ